MLLEIVELLFLWLLKHYDLVLKKQHLDRVIDVIKHQTIKLIDSTTVSLCLLKYMR
jgi:hypothetical protein